MYFSGVLIASLISSIAMALPTNIIPPVDVSELHDDVPGTVTIPLRSGPRVSAPTIDTPAPGSNVAGITKREANSNICPEGYVVAAAAEVATQLITGGGANARHDAIMDNHCKKEEGSSLKDKIKGKIGKLWGRI